MTDRLQHARSRWARIFTVGVVLAAGSAGVIGGTISPAGAATTVTDLAHGVSAQALASSLVGSGVTVSNVTFTGDNRAAGTFSGNASGNNGIGFASGIVLSTGKVQTVSPPTACATGVEGPNQCDNNSTILGKPGDAQLSALAGANANPPAATATTNDAAILEFDFVPSANQVNFSYVFGSEEYDSFTNSKFNDVFAFWVNGTNCALIPGTSTAITVNGVNKGSNAQYFRSNLPRPGTIDTEFNGITTVLSCVASVTSGSTNHMKIAIADTSDTVYDSGVYLKAGSLQAGPPTTTNTTVVGGGSGSIKGRVTDASGRTMSGAPVQACNISTNPPQCYAVVTADTNGDYTVTGLPNASFGVTGYSPPNIDNVTPNSTSTVISGGAAVTGVNIVLGLAKPPPSDTVFTSPTTGTTTGKIPLIFWGEATTIEVSGCVGGGTANLTVTGRELFSGTTVTKSTTLTELKDSTGKGIGRYKGTVPALEPIHGAANFHVDFPSCPPGCTSCTPDFTAWIDPSGTVVDTNNAPISGATVTLFRSDTPDGTFAQVASGSAIMSPGNRVNPMTTNASGFFGWDVVAGYYKVRAAKSGCTAPGNASQAFVETAVLTIPPPVTGLKLQLQCSSTTSTTTPGSSTTTTSTTAVPPGTKTVTRLSGVDRMATAIAVSQQAFPAAASAAAVVLARADTFPDALAGAPLAAKKGGPLLLTATDALDARTETEIKRVLGAGKTVYLLGNALTTAVANQLGSDGFTTVRYGGATRFDTAVVIADQGLGNPSKLFLATGLNFPDALAGGPPAVSVGGAILLTTDATLHASTRAYLNAHTGATRYALGSQAAQADPGATPYAGADRYATALSVAQAFFNTPAAVGLASGASFADALPAGPHLGTLKGPLLLTDGATLTPGFTSYLQARKQGIGPAFVYGGTTRISENAKNSMSQALS